MRTFRNLRCIRHWNGASLAKRLYLKHAGEKMCTSPFIELRNFKMTVYSKGCEPDGERMRKRKRLIWEPTADVELP